MTVGQSYNYLMGSCNTPGELWYDSTTYENTYMHMHVIRKFQLAIYIITIQRQAADI